MNINFFNSCYNIGAMSSVLLQGNEFDHRLNSSKKIEYVIPITERLNAITQYKSDYGWHFFYVSFERDGKYLNEVKYSGYLKDAKLSWLCSKDIAVPAKINAIYKLKPGIVDKAKALVTPTLLTEEEISAVITKSQELTEMAKEFIKADELGVPYKSSAYKELDGIILEMLQNPDLRYDGLEEKITEDNIGLLNEIIASHPEYQEGNKQLISILAKYEHVNEIQEEQGAKTR